MTADTLDWIGHSLASGRYRITARLGEGGMGAVYKAHDANLDSEVVVKVPKPGLVSDHEFTARFAREVRSLVRLAHAHIVRVLDVGEHEGLPFAVMQYLNGGSLRDRLSALRGGSATALADLPSWLAGVADALDYIHQQGYVHRDVKPDNILFDAAGHVYLGDFGIAKALAASEASAGPDATFKTSAGLVVGTPQYMAPELITAQGCDGRVDQYALAVTVYEAVCGQAPFDGSTPAALVVQHATQPPRPPHEVASGIPLAFSTALLRGLAKDPRQRYRDCRSLAQALIAAVPATGRPRREPPPPAAEPDDGKERFTCPHCSLAFRLPPEKRGKVGRCPRCQQKFIVGAAAAAAETPAGGLAPTPLASPAVAPIPAPPQAVTPRRPTPPPRPSERPAAEDTARLDRPLTVLAADPPPRKHLWLFLGVAGIVAFFLLLLVGGIGVWLMTKGSPERREPNVSSTPQPKPASTSEASKVVADKDAATRDPLVQRAETSLANKDYPSAILDCTQALRLNDKAPHAATVRGIAYSRLKKYDEALEDLTHALDLDPKDARALVERGKLYLHVRRDYERAGDDLRRARALDLGNSEIAHQLGEALRFQRHYREAIDQFSEALRLKPNDVSALGGRGSAYRSQGLLSSALADLDAALNQKPNYTFGLAERGEVYQMQGRYNDAINDCTRAIQLGSTYYLAYRARGNAYRMLHKYEDAIHDLNKAIEYGNSGPEPWIAWGELADTYRMKGDYAETLNKCAEAIRLNSKYGFAYATRGAAYRLQGRYDLALESVSRALELEPTNNFALEERAETYRLQGNYDLAINDSTKALSSSNHKSVFAYCTRAAARVSRGKAVLAKPTVQREELDHVSQDFELAVLDLTEALKLNPRYGFAYRQRAQIYEAIAGVAQRVSNRAAYQQAMTRAKADYDMAKLYDGK